ncbi:MAG TPA: hypothetical protein VLA31_03585 [Burkholderiaceae bacterium]|nr:hypothetical protein [Burkholderiaceae bacterium]
MEAREVRATAPSREALVERLVRAATLVELVVVVFTPITQAAGVEVVPGGAAPGLMARPVGPRGREVQTILVLEGVRMATGDMGIIKPLEVQESCTEAVAVVVVLR